jgi:hypothetical protein
MSIILSRFIENSLDFDGCIEATFRELQQKRLDRSTIVAFGQLRFRP